MNNYSEDKADMLNPSKCFDLLVDESTCESIQCMCQRQNLDLNFLKIKKKMDLPPLACGRFNYIASNAACNINIQYSCVLYDIKFKGSTLYLIGKAQF